MRYIKKLKSKIRRLDTKAYIKYWVIGEVKYRLGYSYYIGDTQALSNTNIRNNQPQLKIRNIRILRALKIMKYYYMSKGEFNLAKQLT